MNDPFNPHAIASVRFGTYRWVAVRKYLDNLIEWGDSLFRRDTIESINEATQLYLLAAAVLGDRPKRIEGVTPTASTYDDLDAQALFGGLTELEGFYPGTTPGNFPMLAPGNQPPPPPIWWYFCLPPNEQLLAYWDRVADRLFKIRHCQNIDGVKRQLALFEPPIDPALLVKARAAGLDLSAVLADLDAPLPHYRYRVLVARAIDLCADVRSLGGALLTALEKKDGEELSRLRASHEVAVLKRVRQVRKMQIDEAEAQIVSLRVSRATAEARKAYYLGKQKVSPLEHAQLETTKNAVKWRIAQQSLQHVAGHLAIIPTFQVGTGVFLSIGGEMLSNIVNNIAGAMGLRATVVESEAAQQDVMARYERRYEDWRFQATQAASEVAQIDKQIIAAEIRRDIARRELTNHDRQVAESEQVEAYLHTKYTGTELYDWMIGQLSNLYFQSYRLAYDVAKRAERTMHHELADDGAVAGNSFIQFGHWDGLRKGLLAGERLHLDLKRMETAYLERDAREYELTKRISLRQVAPNQLITLRNTGTAEFDLPEVLFDLDHPGHYMRRIKSVRVTIPAVAGPTTTIGAKLTLLKDMIRFDPDVASGYEIAQQEHEDGRFRINYGGTKAIATSQARDDAGMFELNFRDDRYLPFEGAGVISRWRLELPDAFRQFDYNTITDVEIRIDYTAREGGEPIREALTTPTMTAALQAAMNDENEVALLLSAKQNFGVDWEQMLRPATGSPGGTMSIPITPDRFPFVVQSQQPSVTAVELAFVHDDTAAAPGTGTLTPPSPASATALNFSAVDGIISASADYSSAPVSVDDQAWTLDIDPSVINDADGIHDLLILVRFTVS